METGKDTADGAYFSGQRGLRKNQYKAFAARRASEI